MADFKNTSHIFGANAVYIEELYQRYLEDKTSVDKSWESFFDDMGDSVTSVLLNNKGASWSKRRLKVIGAQIGDTSAPAAKQPSLNTENVKKACADSINALMLIRAYKVRGNLLASLDPLRIEGGKLHPDLNYKTYGFNDSDLERKIFIGGALGYEEIVLGKLIDILQDIYSSDIGVEFMHIPSLAERDWIAGQIESRKKSDQIADEEKISILEDMVKFEEFEQFLHRKYPGAKRFSAEGAEAALAGMEKIISRSAEAGVEEVVIGMAHRGRLNVLTKIMGRRYASLLSEFQGKQAHFPEDLDASGDVKYHQGASGNREINGKKIHLSLSPNPSHLEAVNPVVAGRVRAKQDQLEDHERKRAVGILLHGDSAFCGQGVVAETLALSDLDGYTTGGIIHIIINNQIGFTTAPRKSRKSPYPTDVAKGSHSPIFHVNGDNPESVIFVSKLAVDYRQKFGKDVIIDVVCYRRYGHNEGDEPLFTQPIMYNKIKDHLTPTHVYAARLMAGSTITQEYFDKIRKDFLSFLEKEYEEAQNYKADEADWLKGKWSNYIKPEKGVKDLVKTGISEEEFKKISHKLSTSPDNFNVNSKIERLLNNKKEMVDEGGNIDWALGEAIAYGSLLLDKHNIRFSGQDSRRGTFSHRHAYLIDQDNEDEYCPLNNLSDNQGYFEIIDSNLSEYAVLGYEYGYSLAEPSSLVIWEAQFGDFANGAQIIFDQFISSSEIKWLRLSGITVLLPHGYEGQGPEHSSARLERFLQLCAEDNMQVVNCTTPANFFHVLRRQLLRNFRKPLIVMTPKSLLRHKKCVSSIADFTTETYFKTIIGETEKLVKDDKIKRVVICSGKVYYDLIEAREKNNINDIAIIRMEQYYPFPDGILAEEIKKYKNIEDVIWCQEEPANMGAWHFVDRKIEDMLKGLNLKPKRPTYIGRVEAASPAAGYMKVHNATQQELINKALNVKV